MKRGLLLTFFLVSSPVAFAESFTVYQYSSAEPPDRYRYSCRSSRCGESEINAVKLVNEDYGETLTKRLVNYPLYKNPTYWVYSENECDFTVKALESMPTVASSMGWFDVDICKKTINKIDFSKRR